MLNYEKVMEMYKKGELEKMTWGEFLDGCDVSHWEYEGMSPKIVYENGDYIVAKENVTDDPDFKIIKETENGIIVDWGEPVLVDYIGDAYVVYKREKKEGYPIRYTTDGWITENLEKARKWCDDYAEEEG